MRRLLAGLVLGAVLTLTGSVKAQGWPDLGEPPPPQGGGERDAALVVGVERYAFVPPVAGAVDNAQAWYSFLTRTRGVPVARVRLLRNEQASFEGLLKAAGEVAELAEPGGTVWFVFVGHGAPSRDGRDGLLVGVDAQQTAESLQARSVPQGALTRVLAAGRQAETVMVIDACFSGRTGAGASLAPGLQPLLPVALSVAPAATVLSAGQANEFAGPLPGADRPAFSYLVLGALRGWGDTSGDGQVTAREAVDYAKGVLSAMVRDRAQTPELRGGSATVALSRPGRGAEAGPDLARLVLSSTTVPAPVVPGRVGGGRVQEGVGLDLGETITNALTDDTGFLFVESTPPGAEVLLNGKRSGVTPLQVELMAGRYVVVADAGKLYHKARMEVALTTKGSKLHLELPPAFGRLEVTSEPSGAEVSLDGERVGTTPWSLDRKASGGYELRVVHGSYLPHTEQVAVQDGQTTRRHVKLDANFGALVVDSEPRGAAITLNDAPTGKTTPHTFEALQPGVYVVRLALDGHGEAVERGTVDRLGRATVRASLAPKLALLSVLSSYAGGTPCQGKLFVDGREVGETPAKVEVIATAHAVEVRCPDGMATTQVTLAHNEKRTVTLEVAKGGAQWVSIPGGTFQMGSNEGDSDERPVHSVTVRGFQMAKTETTVGEYRKCVDAGKCSAPETGTYCNWGKSGREDHPVNCVDWNQAKAFCAWAGGRLPTEAEWEYAARSGGRAQSYPWGNEKATCARAVMDDGGNGCGRNSTWPVCSKTGGDSAHGLCDLAGNVWEWVADWKGSYGSSPASDPQGPGSGSDRVRRGGGFYYDASLLRASYRGGHVPSDAGAGLGFRCSRSLVP
ncbi:MAG: hypothetical protein AMXMBFR64_33140 [Myxococcales bacterium]